MTDQSPIHWSKSHSPILRIARLAMVGTAGQRERDEYSAVPLWSKYIALSTKVREGVPIPLPFLAIVTECLIWGLGCCTKDADLKTEQFFSYFTALASDRRRPRDLQPIVSS